MAYKIVKLNKARCKQCGDVVISKDEKKEDSCGCGKLKASGGHSWIRRTGKAGVDYEELSVLNFELVPDTITGNSETTEENNEG